MSFISMNLVTMMYLIASVCFIQALKGLSSPTNARKGNAFGMTGMAIAAVTTVALILKLKAEAANGNIGLGLVLLGVVVGGGIGAYLAKKVEMTKMPELVAAMHSLIGLAAVCIAVAAVSEPHAFNIAAVGEALPIGNRIELFIGTFVGAITFSGSVIAFGKLAVRHHGRYRLRAGCADHHPDRRRRHAGGGVDAELVLRLGGGGHRLLAEQRHADHRRLAGGFVGRHPVLHHVQGHEPFLLQRDPGRLRRRRGGGPHGRRRGAGASGKNRLRR
jgi:hypothetical protein